MRFPLILALLAAPSLAAAQIPDDAFDPPPVSQYRYHARFDNQAIGCLEPGDLDRVESYAHETQASPIANLRRHHCYPVPPELSWKMMSTNEPRSFFRLDEPEIGERGLWILTDEMEGPGIPYMPLHSWRFDR